MKTFADTYQKYINAAESARPGSAMDLKRIEQLEPLFGFLYENWWRVSFTGIDRLPQQGPALIVANGGGVVPWTAAMLMYALMNAEHPRHLSVMADMDWIDDERVYTALTEIGFVSWSASNAKNLLQHGELILMFPEGVPGMVKAVSERNRLRSFDWTRFLPFVDEQVPVYSMACLGCDTATPVIADCKPLARLLGLPAYPITPFFPLLPFPASLITLPVKWDMTILKPHPERIQPGEDREQAAKRIAAFTEGEVQAELNRLIRSRIRPLF